MRKTLMCLLVLIAVVPALAAGPNPWELTIDLTPLGVSNMPFSVRNVPNHPKDTYVSASTAGPISQLKYSTYVMAGVNYTAVKWQAGKGVLNLKAKWMFYPIPSQLGGAAERNYTNAVGSSQRGTGAALTFACLQTRGIIPGTKNVLLDLVTNFTPEVEWVHPISKKLDLIMNASYFSLQAVNGWDRNDLFDIWHYQTLAHCFPLGVGVQFGRHTKLGVKYIPMILTDSGRSAGVKGNFAINSSYAF